MSAIKSPKSRQPHRPAVEKGLVRTMWQAEVVDETRVFLMGDVWDLLFRNCAHVSCACWGTACVNRSS